MNNQQSKKGGRQQKNALPKAPRNKNRSANAPIAKSDASMSRSVQAPVAKANVVRQAKPRFEARLNGDVMVRHREYIQDVAGSVAFTANQFSVNPGLTFPWLSSIAPRWESYRFEKLRICYETEAPTSALGTVLLSVDYDASDAAPTSKQQAMAYRSSVRSPPWSNCCHDSLREDLMKKAPYYVRAGALAANQDVKLYDTANLFVCTQGQADTTTVGELYIEYDVLLMTPQLGDIAVGTAIYGEWTSAASTNAAPFGNTKLGNIQATLVSTGTTTSVTTITFVNPYSGVLGFNATGTGVSGVAFGGTAARLNGIDIVNAGTTNAVGSVSIVAAANQTLSITITNTSLSAGDILIGQGSFT